MKRLRWLLVSMFAFGIVTSASAIPGPQNDPNAPGSVLVFPYFLKGGVTINGVLHPKTEIEVSVTCPVGQVCAEGTRVKIVGHWVCPGSQDPFNKYVCRETDFVIITTVDATVTFNPNNNPPAVGFFNSSAPPQGNVRIAPCPKGYLILWVVDLNDNAIKYDGLLGDAVVRPNVGSAEAYNAIPIQAADAIAHLALTDLDLQGDLDFDNTEYKMTTGVVIAPVRYDDPQPAGKFAVQTSLVLLTLDVASNRPNAPVFVDLDFFNQIEVPTSTFHEFICWTEVPLVRIDGNLTKANQGGTPGRKGYFRSAPAEIVDIFGINSVHAGPATLLGIVRTTEKDTNGVIERSYSYSMFSDGLAVPTFFEP